MSSPLKDYFHYTRAERNGIVILLVLCIFLFGLPCLFPYFLKKDFKEIIFIESLPNNPPIAEKIAAPTAELFLFNPNTADFDTFIKLGLSAKQARTIINYRKKGGRFRHKKDLKKIYGLSTNTYERLAAYIQLPQASYAANIPKNIPTAYSNNSFESKTATTPLPPFKCFPFNPNTATRTELEQLGLSAKVVNTIINFRNKAKFRKASDLSKIFGLSDNDYKRLKPYILLEKQQETAPKIQAFVPKIPVNIDINKATAEEWQKLSGIGPTFSQRIVKFRDKLGGFHSVDQVSETYHLPDSTFQAIRTYLIASPILHKININDITLGELKQHPYISWKKAEIIINYREINGNFQTIEDMKKIHVLDDDLIIKLAPYLAF